MQSPVSKTLEIWTDGACKQNPGPGGWGRISCMAAMYWIFMAVRL